MRLIARCYNLKTPMADVLPPHSAEAEEAVLGSLLIDPMAVPRIASFLQPEDFYIVKNGWIYRTLIKLGERADLLTVAADLAAENLLDDSGGDAYLGQLTGSVPTALNVDAYGKIVEELAIRRRMINAASEIAKIAYDQTTPVEQVLEKSEARVFDVSDKRMAGHMVPIRKAVDEFFARVEYLHEHKDEPLGIPTGYPDIDKLSGGLQKGDLIIVAARPGVGKTSLMLNLSYNAAFRHRQRVAIFSLEMSNEQLVQRFVAAETGIDSQRLRVGDLRDDEWALLSKVCMQMSDLYLFLDDTPSLTPLDLRVKARRIYQEYGLDLIVVDYLQLMQAEGSSRNDNRVQEISYISRALKGIARELKVPLIAGSQLSRMVEQRSDKRPMLSDLRESGCLAGDTLVTLADSGRRVPIRDLAGMNGFRVWSLDPSTWGMTATVASRAFATGVKPTYRLQTRLGRRICATANHKFRTIDGWRRLDELSPGTRIALPRMVCPAESRSMSDSELALLGHLIGDGCTLPSHAVQYTTRDLDLAESVARLASDVFGAEVRPRISAERRWLQVYLASTRRHTHGVHHPIADWLTGLHAWGKRSFEKRVPERVFGQNAAGIALFLRHLWATDGCARMRGGQSSYPAVYYATSSEGLALDVQSLLLRLGINARVKRVSQKGKGRDQHHVIVSGKTDLMQFVRRVGAVGDRRKRLLDDIEAHVSKRLENTNRDVIPGDVWELLVKPAMVRAGVTQRELHKRLGMAYSGMTIFGQNVGRARADRVASAAESIELRHLAQSAVYWDEVAAIEYAGEQEVFDLTVPGPHNFEAAGFFAHNSIEQDSDIVMFIYRDEMYNPDTEVKNIAEISVAKNRNGPTGKANLFFDKKLTSFKNLARERMDLDK